MLVPILGIQTIYTLRACWHQIVCVCGCVFVLCENVCVCVFDVLITLFLITFLFYKNLSNDKKCVEMHFKHTTFVPACFWCDPIKKNMPMLLVWLHQNCLLVCIGLIQTTEKALYAFQCVFKTHTKVLPVWMCSLHGRDIVRAAMPGL